MHTSQPADFSSSRRYGANRSQRMRRGVSSWRVPLRRARRRIDSTLARLETSGRVIDATDRFGTARPLEASLYLGHLANWIGDAHLSLQRAWCGVQQSFHLLGLKP